MPSVCFYFQVHQPFRLRRYRFFDINQRHQYEDEALNRKVVNEVAQNCYLPANRIMLELLQKYRGDFRVAFSISGVALDQLEKHAPTVLDGFKRLADTGHVEFLNETYHHSLAFMFSKVEFKRQVLLHRKKIKSFFGQTAQTFRNTELIYSNEVAQMAESLGYTAIVAEGADTILGWRSPNYVYQPSGCLKLRCLLRNYRLSDDVAYRFSNRAWPEYALTAERLAGWIHQINAAGETINLFMNYEAFGEHQWSDSGIFDFLRVIPRELLRHPHFRFRTPAEVAREYAPVAQLDVPNFVSWADVERDLTSWLGNGMQKDAAEAIYKLEKKVKQGKDPAILETWGRLQSSDHFYHMGTKWFAGGDMARRANPYPSPYDAYGNYMNILTDFYNRMEH